MLKAKKQNQITISLPWPPSVNGYWRAVGRIVRRRVVVSQIISEKGREYRAAAVAAVLEQGSPRIEGPVRVKEYFVPPSRRSYDLDNFRKAGRDALVHAGVIEDDSLIEEDMGFKVTPDPKRPRIDYVIERLGGKA